MKKLVSVIPALAVVIGICSISATAAITDINNTAKILDTAQTAGVINIINEDNTKQVNGFLYYITDQNSATLAGCTSAPNDLVIPSKLDGHTVTHIADGAFTGNNYITSVTIPDTVQKIEDFAFAFMTRLQSVKMSGAATRYVGDCAFYGCKNLSDITFPDSLYRVGKSAFDNTAWIQNQPSGFVYAGTALYTYKGNMPAGTMLVVRDGTTCIADQAFTSVPYINVLRLPNSLLSIGDLSFAENNFKTVVIPDSVTYIGNGAFDGCTNLKNVTISKNATVGGAAFYDTSWFDNQPDGAIYINNCFYAYKGNVPDNTVLNIKNGTTTICPYAFLTSSNVTKIKIPNTVKQIGEYAFSDSAVESIVIPDSVTDIGESAFSNCSALKSITLSKNITAIHPYTFCDCTSLDKVDIPDDVKIIDEFAFFGCFKLNRVTLPDSLIAVGYVAFCDCSALKDITIPSATKHISDFAFGFSASSGNFIKHNNFSITGYNDTEAQRYAEEYDFKFISLGDCMRVLLGDVDGDGVVSITDATAIQLKLAKLNVAVYVAAAADTDQDAYITISDATFIQMYLAKLLKNTQINTYVAIK